MFRKHVGRCPGGRPLCGAGCRANRHPTDRRRWEQEARTRTQQRSLQSSKSAAAQLSDTSRL